MPRVIPSFTARVYDPSPPVKLTPRMVPFAPYSSTPAREIQTSPRHTVRVSKATRIPRARSRIRSSLLSGPRGLAMRRLQAGSMPVWPRSGHYYYGASRHMIGGPGTDCQGPPDSLLSNHCTSGTPQTGRRLDPRGGGRHTGNRETRRPARAPPHLRLGAPSAASVDAPRVGS